MEFYYNSENYYWLRTTQSRNYALSSIQKARYIHYIFKVAWVGRWQLAKLPKDLNLNSIRSFEFPMYGKLYVSSWAFRPHFWSCQIISAKVSVRDSLDSYQSHSVYVKLIKLHGSYSDHDHISSLSDTNNIRYLEKKREVKITIRFSYYHNFSAWNFGP